MQNYMNCDGGLHYLITSWTGTELNFMSFFFFKWWHCIFIWQEEEGREEEDGEEQAAGEGDEVGRGKEREMTFERNLSFQKFSVQETAGLSQWWKLHYL